MASGKDGVNGAAPVRRPSTRTGGRVQELGLSHLFVMGSKSQQVAERLLDGDPHTRKELAAAAKIAASSVTRVVDTLQEAGVRIERDRAETRDAVYRAHIVANAEAPGNSWTFVAPREEGPIMALHNMESYEEDGTLKLRLRLSGPLGTVQGSAEMTPAVTELARTGLPLTKVTIVAGGEQDWLLGSPADPVVVRGVQWISASPEGKSS